MQKVILILLLFATAAPAGLAQQKTAHHLMVTITENYSLGGSKDLIETHEDGSQVRRSIGFHIPLSIKSIMEHEDTLLLALKPYFDQGWELTASTSTVTDNAQFTTRFFLRKEE